MIENKVAKSGLITLDLETFRDPREVVPFDLKDYLYMELMLREKDFRAALEVVNWEAYRDKVIAVYCSTDAILAHWAFMLVASKAAGIASDVIFGTPEQIKEKLHLERLEKQDWSQYEGKKVLFKGCSQEELSASVYTRATQLILPWTDKLMYGEACSFVPVFSRKKSSARNTTISRN